jgi:OOP family OmpA-OmpF porin
MSNIGLLPRFVSALGACLVLAFPDRAFAGDCNDDTHLGTCIEADTLWPHAGAARFQSVGATETTARKQFSFGLVTTYLRKPIVLRTASANPSGTDIPAVDHLLDSTFLWAFGITDQLEASAAMPMTLYRTGSGISAFASTQARELPKTSLRDLRFGLAYAIIPRPRVFPGSHYALTARFDAAMPTGEQEWFAGDRAAVWMPSVAADYRRGPWFAGLELGARLRQTTDLAGARIGSQGFASLGVGVDIIPRELLSATLEAFALPSFVSQTRLHRDPLTQELATESSDRKQIPAEWLAGVRTAPTADGDVSFSLSGGTVIPLTSTSAVTAPAYRFVLGARYAPIERDSDGDGVLDRDDLCPQEKEDVDGFEDQDGCDDRDNDRDGIPDSVDRCRDKPEDKDGFQDDDGCPDLDDDNDGIPDAQDQCRFKPEDRDGFQDDDGCPDLDNDNDGIPDSQDRCPDGPEDKDGFNDADGCPDPDNDADGIPDDKDRCPNSREDKDGFHDDDGCPDPDNDEDGIPDDKDRCPNEAETIDGKDDADGCPEPGARDVTVVTGANVAVTSPARFLPGQAAMNPQLRAQLRMIAQRVMGIQPLQSVIVETYADTQGANDRNEKLAADRADAIRQELIAAGVPTELLTAAVGDLTQKRPTKAPQYQVTVQRGTWK